MTKPQFRYAVRTSAPGTPARFRKVRADHQPADGEFLVDHVPPGGRIGDDGASVRHPTEAEEQAAARKPEIIKRLAVLDQRSIRPARAVAAGTATANDTDRLAEIETEAQALRSELAGLA